jgi:hypothetical protein
VWRPRHQHLRLETALNALAVRFGDRLPV